MKVLGFYDKEVSAYMYRENILLTLIGAAVGSGLGIVLQPLHDPDRGDRYVYVRAGNQAYELCDFDSVYLRVFRDRQRVYALQIKEN